MKFYIGSSFKNFENVNYIAKKLVDIGWTHTYNWAEHILGEETLEDLREFSIIEQKAIAESDIVIIMLPAGRGSHVELGISIALNKKVYLVSTDKKDFNIENLVNFYEHPNVTRLVGNMDDIINKIIDKSCKKY